MFNIAYWLDGERHFGSDWPLDANDPSWHVWLRFSRAF
jgi:hypothetical protein